MQIKCKGVLFHIEIYEKIKLNLKVLECLIFNHFMTTTFNSCTQNLQKAQMNGVNALFDRASSRTGSAMSSARPGSSSQVMEDGTIFSDASPVSSAR